MKLIFHRQPARIVPRVSFPRSARWFALTFIGFFVCAVDVRSDTADDENTIYDSDPKHLWNRLQETLFIRTAPGWKSYGIDRLDLLFWSSTKHLLVEPSHRQALAVLDEFLNPGIAQMSSFERAQQFSEFVMSRRLEGLLRAVTKGEKDILFVQLHSGGMDPFEFVVPDGVAIEGPNRLREDQLQSNVLQSCSNCHTASGIHSVLTYNQTFGLTSFRGPLELVDSNPEHEAMVTIQWKRRQSDWGLLQGLWKHFR